MRRLLVAACATLAVVAGLLAAGTTPATADPGAVFILGAGTTTTTSAPLFLSAHLDESPCCGQAETYDWDLDADGSYDDHSGQLAGWNPAGRTPGNYTVSVRVVVDGQTFTASAVIHLELPTSDTFFATLSPLTVTVGEEAFLHVTLTGLPGGATPTLEWDLDDDGAFDDSTADYGTFSSTVLGDHTVRVRARHDGMLPADPPAIATTKITVIPAVPQVTLSAVTVSGTARVGYLLTSGGGVATPSDAVRTVQWLRDGVPISAVTATYRLSTADAGRRITVRVGATQDGYVDATPGISKAIAVAAYNLTRPTYTGTTRVGRKLTGKAGTWQAPSHTTSYRWLRDGKAITGATRSTYVTNRFDRGHKLSFRVYKKRSGFPTVSATSTARTITR